MLALLDWELKRIEENLMILCFLEVIFEAEGCVFNRRANVALI